MDPVTALGAAGSVVGIAGFGIQLSQILIKYLSQIWSAQESLETIVDEIDSTTSALEEIYFFLRQEVVNLKRGKPLYLFSETSLIKVKITADRCLVVFWRVEATISGNWPVGLEDELVRRLTEFNQKLDSYKPGSPIQIESELTSDPLGLRDKLRWASKASKLDKYCKQLQRYQDNLVLLLQVVSLGQQRMKPNPTEEGVRLMLRTYELIKQAATPKELQNIAYEAQIQSQKRRGNPRRDPSVAPSYTTRPRTPSRARGVLIKVTTNPEPSKPSVARSRDISVPQATAMSSIRAKSPSTIISSPTGKAFVNGHDNASHVPTGDRPSSPTFASRSLKPLCFRAHRRMETASRHHHHRLKCTALFRMDRQLVPKYQALWSNGISLRDCP
ncbi:hypothetical protein HD806DRAFT_524504 [Xylariaceae sp. AK1471]|nr:hypothetical protein HD806DRAFT_524504 [Xylariaceae sp. AK1471]